MQCYIIHVCAGKGCLDEVVRVILHDQMDRKWSDLDPLPADDMALMFHHQTAEIRLLVIVVGISTCHM